MAKEPSPRPLLYTLTGAKMVTLFLLALTVLGCESLMQVIPPLPTKTPFILTELPPGAQEVPFEPIFQEVISQYRDYRPGLAIITDPDQAQEFEETIYPESPIQLSTIDFHHQFVIIAFYGHRPMGGPRIEIKQIVRRDSQVDVYAYFTDVPRGQPRPAMPVSPLHGVKVRKTTEWGGEFTFTLYDNNQPVAETRHFIP